MRDRLPAALFLAAVLSAGCTAARPGPILSPQRDGACRAAVSPAGSPATQAIRWTAPQQAGDRKTLDAWCTHVGPAVVGAPPEKDAKLATQSDVVLLSWNVHVGAGDVVALVEQLRAGRWTDGRPVDRFVLLLQETYRRGGLVPRGGGERGTARTIRPHAPGRRIDVVALADTLGLSLYYVPSMRNGPARETDEDRGNAILSTEPLLDLEAIELPFERQRRVALQATVRLEGTGGDRLELRLTNAHLENVGPARRLGVFSTLSRLEQAQALLERVPRQGAAVLGGDLNTWFGTLEPAFRRLSARFDPPARSDGRPTFGGLLRLDHLLLRLPGTWEAQTIRLERFGSDHHPLLARLRRSGTHETPADPR